MKASAFCYEAEV